MTFETYKHISAQDLIWVICDHFPEMTYNVTNDLLEQYCDCFGDFDSMSFCYEPIYREKEQFYRSTYFDKYISYVFNTYFPEDKVIVVEW